MLRTAVARDFYFQVWYMHWQQCGLQLNVMQQVKLHRACSRRAAQPCTIMHLAVHLLSPQQQSCSCSQQLQPMPIALLK
jgi:hypothetical protein